MLLSWFLVFLFCGVESKFTTWNEWSACSAECGLGKKTRERLLAPLPGDGCYSSIIEEAQCNSVCPRLINLSRGKLATASSNMFKLYPASKATDGNRKNELNQKSCMHTEKDSKPWLRITLTAQSLIRMVTIVNRGDCCSERLNNLYITVSNDPDGKDEKICARSDNNTDVMELTLKCSKVLHGKYVFLRIPGPQFLHVCEVDVMGYALRNLALKRGTTMSPHYSRYTSNLAVNGNLNDWAMTKNISNPFWQVDLGTEYFVWKVTIVVPEPYDRLSNTLVTVGNNLDGSKNQICGTTDETNTKRTVILNCPHLMHGRYVKLQKFGHDFLSLNEVLVEGS